MNRLVAPPEVQAMVRGGQGGAIFMGGPALPEDREEEQHAALDGEPAGLIVGAPLRGNRGGEEGASGDRGGKKRLKAAPHDMAFRPPPSPPPAGGLDVSAAPPPSRSPSVPTLPPPSAPQLAAVGAFAPLVTVGSPPVGKALRAVVSAPSDVSSFAGCCCL